MQRAVLIGLRSAGKAMFPVSPGVLANLQFMEEKRDTTEKRQYFLIFPEELINHPILYKVSTEFDVIPNILGASINDKMGKVAIELEGVPEKLDAVIQYFLDLGVKVENLPDTESIKKRLAEE